MRRASDPKNERLRTVELFAHLSDHDLRRVGRLVSEATRPAGTVLIEQDRHAAEAFVILAGRVSVVRDGHELAQLGPGAVVGELSLLDRGTRSATVVAATDVEALVLSEQEFHQLLNEQPTVGHRLLREVGRRLRAADDALTEASSTFSRQPAWLHVLEHPDPWIRSGS